MATILAAPVRFLPLIATLAAAACGHDPHVRVEIEPAGTINVAQGATVQFSARVSGTLRDGVIWSLETLNPISLPTSLAGTVDDAGWYTAPLSIPPPLFDGITLVATSEADESAQARVELHLVAPPITPMTGPSEGGTWVRIDGITVPDGANPSVTFDGTAAPQVRVDGRALFALTPPHAIGVADIDVRMDDRRLTLFHQSFHYHATQFELGGMRFVDVCAASPRISQFVQLDPCTPEPELLVICSSGPDLRVFAVGDDGRIGASRSFPFSSEMFKQLITDDLDGDGNRDLLIARATDVVRLRNKGVRDGGTCTWEGLDDAEVVGTKLNLIEMQRVDMNGDGFADLAVRGTSNVVVWPGTSDGDFDSENVREAASSPSYIYGFLASDVNNDGYGDVILSTGVLDTFLGDADDNYTFAGRSSINETLTSLLHQDVDKDGVREIIGLSLSSTPVSILHWSVDTPPLVRVGRYLSGTLTRPGDPIIADFNNDGEVDLAYSGEFDAWLSVHWGPLALPDLSAPTTIALPSAPVDWQLLQPKGQPLTVLMSSNTTRPATILRNVGTVAAPRFGARSIYASPAAQAGSLSFLPLNEDQLPAGFVSPYYGGATTIIQGQGLSWPATGTIDLTTLSVREARLNEDSLADALGIEPQGFWTATGGSNGLTDLHRVTLTASNRGDATDGLILDFDGDARLDVILSRRELPSFGSPGTIEIVSGATDWLLGDTATPEVLRAGSPMTQLLAVDMNRDQARDVVAISRDHRNIRILPAHAPGAPDETSDDSPSIEVADAPVMARHADLNGDGYEDLMILTDKTITIVSNQEGEKLSIGQIIELDGTRAQEFDYADLDGDGIRDLVVAMQQANGLAYFRGLADGFFAEAVPLAGVGIPTQLSADVRAENGLPSLMVWDFSGSQLQLLENKSW